MSSFKDNITNNERRYLFLAPLMFLLGFGLFLLEFIIGLDTEFLIDGKSGIFINVIGAVLIGYGLSVECSIIHYMLNLIRQKQGIVKALFIVLFVPALLAGFVFSAIMTIPYYYFCSNKLKQIKTDDNGVLLKWQKIVFIVLGVIDIIILIAYFFVI